MSQPGLKAANKGAKAHRAIAPARTVHVLPEGHVAPKDHFITRNGLTYAGSHLVVDLWDADGLDDRKRIKKAFLEAVKAAGATLLHIHLHTFTGSGGISGVAVLAESHISIHTWPERRYAAIDVFMCGDADPRKAVAVLRKEFPGRIVIGEHKRGVI